MYYMFCYMGGRHVLYDILYGCMDAQYDIIEVGQAPTLCYTLRFTGMFSMIYFMEEGMHYMIYADGGEMYYMIFSDGGRDALSDIIDEGEGCTIWYTFRRHGCTI